MSTFPQRSPRLYYVAIPPEVAAQLAFHVHPSELTLSVCLDIGLAAAAKPKPTVRALR